jgi:hypothetical protein
MQDLLTNAWLWTAVLGGVLFYPTRQLMWALSVRREERRSGQPASEERRRALKRRTSVTAAMLCFVFSVTYVHVLMANIYGRP